MNVRLVDRSNLCVLCGGSPHSVSCSEAWPRPMTKRRLLTRVLVGLGAFLALSAMVVPAHGLGLGLALSALACCTLYTLLRLGEMPTEQAGRGSSRGRR